MAVVNDPYTFPENWGQVVLVGYGPLPGYLVGLKGLKRGHEWVYQKGVGTSGASSIWRGEQIIEEMGILLEAPYAKDFEDISRLIPVLVPAKGKKPATFGIIHPLFSLVRVDRVSLKNYGMEPSAGNSWQLAIGLTEYRPTIKAAVGPADPAKLPGGAKPKDAIDEQIDAIRSAIAKAGS
jgi:hypothetical protein